MRLDLPGTVLVVAGLVVFVYGLSEADTKGWGAPLTTGLLVGGAVLLVLFVLTERRVAHPLLPLRIVLDRFRGGAYLAIGLSAIGLFGVFLFLELTEIFLAVGNFSSSVGLSQVGGYLGLVTALVAWYTSAAGVSAGIGGRIQLPVGRPLIS